MTPAPRSNPDGKLMGSWVVLGLTGKVVARFPVDGRDKAEAWIAARLEAKSRRDRAVSAGVQ